MSIKWRWSGRIAIIPSGHDRWFPTKVPKFIYPARLVIIEEIKEISIGNIKKDLNK